MFGGEEDVAFDLLFNICENSVQAEMKIDELDINEAGVEQPELEEEEWEEDTNPEAEFALAETRGQAMAEALAATVPSCSGWTEGRHPETVDRLLDDWKETPGVKLDVTFGGLKAGDKMVLPTSEAPWIPPLCLAGVTTFGIGGKPDAEQMATLLARLVPLTSDYPSVKAMRDWLVTKPIPSLDLRLEKVESEDEEAEAEPAPPQVLAVRALELVEAVSPFAFLTYLSEIRSGDTPFDSAVRGHAETWDNGKAVSAALLLDDSSIQALVPVLSAPPTALTSSMAHSFVDWATTDPGALQRLAQLMMAVGFEAFLAKLDLSQMSERALTVVGRLLKACGASAALLGDLLAKSTAGAGVKLAAALPGEELWKLKKPVEKLLLACNPAEATELLRLLLLEKQFDWLPTLAEIVTRTKGDGFPLQVLRSLFTVLHKRGKTLDVLVPLVKGRDVKQEVRLTALRLVELDEDALWEASQFSLGDMFIPKDIRERLKQARKRLEE